MKKLVLPGACALTLAISACGVTDKLAEEATEELLEEALQSEGIEKLEIDSNGNTVIIGEDGEKVVISADGENTSVEITNEDGDSIASIDNNGESFVVDDGEGNVAIGGTTLADGWPSQYPLPDGISIITSLRSVSEGEIAYMTQFEGDLSFDDVAAAMRAYGDSPTVDQESELDGTQSLLLSFELDNGATVTVLLAHDAGSPLVGTVGVTNWIE